MNILIDIVLLVLPLDSSVTLWLHEELEVAYGKVKYIQETRGKSLFHLHEFPLSVT